MKKLTFIAIAVCALAFSACNQNTPENSGSMPIHMSDKVYTCPMHPEVLSDKPGKCPKCKMDLVEKTGVEEDHTGHNH